MRTTISMCVSYQDPAPRKAGPSRGCHHACSSALSLLTQSVNIRCPAKTVSFMPSSLCLMAAFYPVARCFSLSQKCFIILYVSVDSKYLLEVYVFFGSETIFSVPFIPCYFIVTKKWPFCIIFAVLFSLCKAGLYRLLWYMLFNCRQLYFFFSQFLYYSGGNL